MPRQRADIEGMEARLDQALMDTFPASDPISFLQPYPARERRRSKALAGLRHIDVRAQQEVRFWSRELGVDAGRVRTAVARVGSGVDSVRRHLGK